MYNSELVFVDSDFHGLKPKSETPRVARKSTSTSSVDSRKTLMTRRQAALAKDKISILQASISEHDRLMDALDADVGSREKRRLRKPLYQRRIPPGAIHDEQGIHISSGVDLCDCLQKYCVGCHFPCKKCNSQKCGAECRVFRRYTYDEIEYHGYDFIMRNSIK